MECQAGIPASAAAELPLLHRNTHCCTTACRCGLPLRRASGAKGRCCAAVLDEVLDCFLLTLLPHLPLPASCRLPQQKVKVEGEVLRWHHENGKEIVPALQYIEQLERELADLRQQVRLVEEWDWVSGLGGPHSLGRPAAAAEVGSSLRRAEWDRQSVCCSSAAVTGNACLPLAVRETPPARSSPPSLPPSAPPTFPQMEAAQAAQAAAKLQQALPGNQLLGGERGMVVCVLVGDLGWWGADALPPSS